MNNKEVKRLETETKFKELLISEGYTPLFDNYVNNLTKVLIRHEICGNKYYSTMARFNRGNRCRVCLFTNKRIPFLQIKTMIENNTDNEYTLLSENTKTNRDKIEILHNKCKTIYFGTPSGFQQGKRCRKCTIVESGLKRKKSLAIYSKIIEEGTNNEYKIISNENDISHHTIHLLHTKCNTTYTVSMSNFKKGCRCPYCANLATESKGVSLIKDILNYLNIYYLQEYRFNECKNYRSLPFDFCILLKDNKYILIEYDGKQHFQSWNNIKEQLKVQQLRDNIKNQYCLDNDIPLLRIPYTDKNIEETLITFLEEYEDLLIFK